MRSPEVVTQLRHHHVGRWPARTRCWLRVRAVGETGAAEALVGTNGDRVYRLARRITGNQSDAKQVTQDALWAARVQD